MSLNHALSDDACDKLKSMTHFTVYALTIINTVQSKQNVTLSVPIMNRIPIGLVCLFR